MNLSRRDQAPQQQIRLLRVIARLNIGGPAIQAIDMTWALEQAGYATKLVSGIEEPDEGSMLDLAQQRGVEPKRMPSIRRNPHPRDLLALVQLVVAMRRFKPQVLHTHAAKAGTLGRVAALIAFPRKAARPVIVHTFHGHSLSGYFSSRSTAVFRRIEQELAKVTDQLVAVSPQIRSELLEMGVGQPDQFGVVRLGFDLQPFVDAATDRQLRSELRQEWGLNDQQIAVVLVARLVPIKRVDRFLRALKQVCLDQNVVAVIVGDGELRDELQASVEAQNLQSQIVWAGFRRDMPAVYAAADVVVLCSDNEGTPVSLIEASASAKPVVTTRVGGVEAVVEHGKTGFIAEVDNEEEFAVQIQQLVANAQLRQQFGLAGQQRSTATFKRERLASDLDELYRRLMASRQKL